MKTYPAAAVAELLANLESICRTDADRLALKIIDDQAEAIWRAVGKLTKTAEGHRLQEIDQQFVHPASGRRSPANPEFTWLFPSPEQWQRTRFISLLRNIFEIVRRPLPDGEAEMGVSRLSACAECLSDVARALDPAALKAASLAHLYAAAGSSRLARLHGSESEDLTADLAALRRIEALVAKLALRSERQRKRSDPREKALQLSLVEAFERHFGAPHHGIAANITAAALGTNPNRSISRSAKLLAFKPVR